MKTTVQKLVLLALLVLLSAPLLSACNTTKGLGEDMEALGENISEEAEEKKKY